MKYIKTFNNLCILTLSDAEVCEIYTMAFKDLVKTFTNSDDPLTGPFKVLKYPKTSNYKLIKVLVDEEHVLIIRQPDDYIDTISIALGQYDTTYYPVSSSVYEYLKTKAGESKSEDFPTGYVSTDLLYHLQLKIDKLIEILVKNNPPKLGVYIKWLLSIRSQQTKELEKQEKVRIDTEIAANIVREKIPDAVVTKVRPLYTEFEVTYNENNSTKPKTMRISGWEVEVYKILNNPLTE